MFCNAGVYLGYPNRKKYRVFILHVSPEKLALVETETGSYERLAKKLLRLVFKDILETDPNSVCCTQSEGRTLLDQQYL